MKNYLKMKPYSAVKWFLFLEAIIKDPKLNTWHLSLLFGLAQLAYIQNEDRIIHVSRSKLMVLSHINTLPTYHKYFRQLQDMGYIKYTPSYHPGYRSIVELLNFNK